MFRFAGKESARTNRLTLVNGSFPLRSQRSHARVFGRGSGPVLFSLVGDQVLAT